MLVWIAGAIGGGVYSYYQHIPAAVAAPVLLAFLVELSFYFGLGSTAVRDRLEALGTKLPLFLLASAAAPFLIATVPAGTFDFRNALYLLACAGALAWWFQTLPRHPVADYGFLAFVAAVYLLKIFRGLYPGPLDDLRIDALGQLMWIRLGISAALLIRKVEGTGFGFVPSRREWAIGARHYVYFLPVGVALMYGLGFARFDPLEGWWWRIPANFVGMLLVVALAEEFFFRGMLQQWLGRWTGTQAAIVAAAVVFGACHLWFREFPNWRFALLAAAAGWFYGRAFTAGRGIRAAMVAHALTNATWRSLFQ